METVIPPNLLNWTNLRFKFGAQLNNINVQCWQQKVLTHTTAPTIKSLNFFLGQVNSNYFKDSARAWLTSCSALSPDVKVVRIALWLPAYLFYIPFLSHFIFRKNRQKLKLLLLSDLQAFQIYLPATHTSTHLHAHTVFVSVSGRPIDLSP